MGRRALFSGLIVDEYEKPVELVIVGGEPFYVVDDDGFKRHIESEFVDRQVLEHIFELIEGNEELFAEGAMKMLGQEDIFTKAALERSLKDFDAQFDALIARGLPEEARVWLGMLGFRVVINLHGDVLEVTQTGASEDRED